MRRLLVLTAALLLVPAASARPSADRPVAIVTAETSNQVIAVSLGPHGGRVLKRVHLYDPLMIASAPHGPAVVVSPRGGTVTLLAWRTLRPIKVFHAFRLPEVAAIAPSGRLAYVTDERTGDLSVIDLVRRTIIRRVFVGLEAHHLGLSPDGDWIWVALGETAKTIVRLDTSNPRRPRVVGRIHPRVAVHDVAFAPGGRIALVSSASASSVSAYSAGGKLLWSAGGGKGPQHVAFSGDSALVSSGYGSSLETLTWRSPSRAPHVTAAPYGSFNLVAYGGFVVTTSLLTGQVSEFRVSDLHRQWTTKVAPAARYVAVSLWPR